MTNNEIKIYITLLNLGESSVNDIGSKSGLHRQVCYDALDRLLEKGFVSYVTKNNKKFFNALNPDKIIDYLEEEKYEIDKRKKEVTKILPKLKDMFNYEASETNVEVIKGSKVLRTILNDVILTLKGTNNEIYIIGVDETQFFEFDEITFQQYIIKLKKYKIREKLLTKESATKFLSGTQSEYRMVPDNLFNPNPTHIYGDKVAIIIWGKPTYGIIIKNKQVADANRKYFQMLWKIAKKKR